MIVGCILVYLAGMLALFLSAARAKMFPALDDLPRAASMPKNVAGFDGEIILTDEATIG